MHVQLQAQITKASLQASGLTCAMCAKSVYSNLSSLSFVESIDTDLNASAFLITFKKGAAVDIDALSKKVEDAGFSVAVLKVTAVVKKQLVKNDSHLELNGKQFHFINIKQQELPAEIEMRIIDQHFVSTKEFKKFSAMTKFECVKTGKVMPCCDPFGISVGTRIYHVTI